MKWFTKLDRDDSRALDQEPWKPNIKSVHEHLSDWRIYNPVAHQHPTAALVPNAGPVFFNHRPASSYPRWEYWTWTEADLLANTGISGISGTSKFLTKSHSRQSISSLRSLWRSSDGRIISYLMTEPPSHKAAHTHLNIAGSESHRSAPWYLTLGRG